MRDTLNDTAFRVAVAPASPADNTAQVGFWIDRLGYEGLTFAIATGTLADADATFTVLIEDADASDKSDAADVADGDLVSPIVGVAAEVAASFSYAVDNTTRKIGYVGHKRYVRMTITPAANASAAPMAAIANLSHAASRPAL